METPMIDGFIYTVRSKSHPELVYYGSTEQQLSRRMAGHRSDYKKFVAGTAKGVCTSMQIMALGDAYIELVEAVQVPSKQHMKAIEGRYQRENECVNLHVAGRSTYEYRQLPEVKAAIQARRDTPEYKAVAAARQSTPEAKALQAISRSKPERKAAQALNLAKWRQTPKGKAYTKEKDAKPEAKARRLARQKTPEAKALAKARRDTPEAKAAISIRGKAYYEARKANAAL
jgi:hypothetical protein